MILGLIIWPTTVFGADNSIEPEFNPMCWKSDECIKARKDSGVPEAIAVEGFLSEEAPCDKKDYGKCLAGTAVTTSIKFGGQSRFTDIGQFLIVNFNYILGVVGILAVIMIIIAGAQWATSAGNSEAIGSAKKRIGGALIGSAIAYLSYVILNTINPALVNLRLPQTFLIRNQALSFTYCDQSPTTTLFAFAGKSQEQDSVIKEAYLKVTEFPLNLSKPEELKCGSKYFIEKASGATCLGSFCAPSGNKAKLCALDSSQNVKNVYECIDGLIGGRVTLKSLLKEITPSPGITTEVWDDPPIDDNETELWSVCADGDTTDVGGGDRGVTIDDKNQTYLISGEVSDLEEAAAHCSSTHSGLKGFVLMFEMNENMDASDEEHYVGWNDGQAIDLGDDRYFKQNVKNIKNQYFIPLDEFRQKGGITLDVEADNITDMDEAADYAVYKGLLN